MIPLRHASRLLLLPVCLSACALHYGLLQERVTGDQSRPQLRWESFPTAAELAADESGFLQSARRITYDVRVYRQQDGKLTVDRRGVAGTTYVVMAELRRGETYRWTVRPRFTVDGQTRIGQWSMITPSPWASSVVPVPVANYASFTVK